jgi:hypothetical protein
MSSEADHRRTVLTLFVALGLTAMGWLWALPYVGWAASVVWFAPATVLCRPVLGEIRNRWLGAAFVLPSGLGLFASLVCLVQSFALFGALGFIKLAATTALTTGLAWYFSPGRTERATKKLLENLASETETGTRGED